MKTMRAESKAMNVRRRVFGGRRGGWNWKTLSRSPEKERRLLQIPIRAATAKGAGSDLLPQIVHSARRS